MRTTYFRRTRRADRFARRRPERSRHEQDRRLVSTARWYRWVYRICGPSRYESAAGRALIALIDSRPLPLLPFHVRFDFAMMPRSILAAIAFAALAYPGVAPVQAVEPIQIGFLWHMHQPVYIPGETITQTDANQHFSFSVTDVHNQRFGPYTSWPKDAIEAGLGLPHLGAAGFVFRIAHRELEPSRGGRDQRGHVE